jgi:hypothetical protein
MYGVSGKDKVDVLSVPGNNSALLGFSPHKFAVLAGFELSPRTDASISAAMLGPQRYGYYAYDAAGSPLFRDFGTEVLLCSGLPWRCPAQILVPLLFLLPQATTSVAAFSQHSNAPAAIVPERRACWTSGARLSTTVWPSLALIPQPLTMRDKGSRFCLSTPRTLRIAVIKVERGSRPAS